MNCLSGAGIVFGNITNNNVVFFSEVASSLGAVVVQPSNAAEATFFVASTVLRLPDGSDPYLIALDSNPALVMVSTGWLEACKEQQKKVPTQEYLLGPLSGIRVTITNFGAKERDTVVSQLKQAGASYSPELYRHSTHVVGNRPGGNKYMHAKEWGVTIVHHDWVLECIKAGRRLDETPYRLDTYASAGVAVATGLELQRQPSRTVSSSRGVVPAASGAGDVPTAGTVPVRQAASGSIRGVLAPRPADSALGGSFVSAGGVNSRGGFGPDDTAAVAGKAGPGGPMATTTTTDLQPPCGSSRHADQFFTVPAIPPDDCYFLHWVRMWVAGCTSTEQSHVLAAVRESGATREPVLHPAMTHIVFGSIPSTADLAEVRQHMAEHREQVKLVRLSWLYECVKRRTYVEPEGPYAMALPRLDLMQAGVGTGSLVSAQHTGPTASLAAPAGSAAAAAVATCSRLIPAQDDYVPLDPEGTTRTMDYPAVRPGGSGVFTGLWFTLMAVANTEEEAEANMLVRQGGGMIMSASTEKEIRDPQRRYAVCPFSLPQALVDRVCSAARSRDRGQCEFDRVPEKQRVTAVWLKACVSRGELLPVIRETPLFRPLPHALPLPRFQALTVAVSQYHMEQRQVLDKLITALGGTYTEKLNKRCNYLVIPEATGDKFTHALRWAIPCVRADWVLESALAGRPLDDQIMAFLPKGITWEEMEEQRAAARRGAGGGGSLASQMGTTQLGPTQRPGGGGMPVSQVPASMPARRGPQASSQLDGEERTAFATAAMLPPPRPPQPPPDRQAPSAPTSGLMGPAASLPPRLDHQPMGPPPPKPPPPPPVWKAILQQDSPEADGSSAAGLHMHGPHHEVADRGAEGRSAAGPQAGNPLVLSPSGCPSYEQASTRRDGGATGVKPGSGDASDYAEGDHADTIMGEESKAGPSMPPPLSATALTGGYTHGSEPGGPAAHEDDGAAAQLMDFLNSNKLVSEPMCSQVDLPLPMPLPLLPPSGPLGGDGPAMSSLSSRELGSVMSLKSADVDGGGGPITGRRSRKRTAAAVVTEPPSLTGKAGGLPGRRGRNDDEDVGFGVAMSQQVGYESAAAAPPPRTRSAARGGRGAQGNSDAKAGQGTR